MLLQFQLAYQAIDRRPTVLELYLAQYQPRGIAVVAAAEFDLHPYQFPLSVGASLTILRRHPSLQRIPLVCLGGALAGLAAWPLADPFTLAASSYATLAVTGLMQMPLALVLITSATRHLPAPEVSLFLLIETVLGPIWVWWAMGEQPPELTLVGGAGILGAIAVNSALALRGSRMGPAPIDVTGK